MKTKLLLFFGLRDLKNVAMSYTPLTLTKEITWDYVTYLTRHGPVTYRMAARNSGLVRTLIFAPYTCVGKILVIG